MGQTKQIGVGCEDNRNLNTWRQRLRNLQFSQVCDLLERYAEYWNLTGYTQRYILTKKTNDVPGICLRHNRLKTIGWCGNLPSRERCMISFIMSA